MSANDLADAVDAWAEADESNARNYSFVSTAQTLNERAPDLRAAAVLLREQAEQLDTLRNAIAAHQDCCLTDFWPELRDGDQRPPGDLLVSLDPDGVAARLLGGDA